MSKKTPASQLRASENYRQKLARKPISFKRDDDKDLLTAISNDDEALNALVLRLLRQHYNLPSDK